MREYLIEQLAIDETQVVDVEGLLDLDDLMVALRHRRPPRAALRALDAGGAARRSRTPTTATADVFAAMRAGDLLVHHPYHSFAGSVERFVQPGREGPRRARDQDDRVPHVRRLGARAGADRGGRARQAGGLPRGAEGALRRAPQHRLGARARGGGRARGARAAGAEDAREGAAGGAPRGLAACATTCTSGPATTTPRRRACTRTSGCSPATAGSAPTWRSCSTRSPARRARPEYRKAVVAPDHMRDWFLDEVAAGRSRRSARGRGGAHRR